LLLLFEPLLGRDVVDEEELDVDGRLFFDELDCPEVVVVTEVLLRPRPSIVGVSIIVQSRNTDTRVRNFFIAVDIYRVRDW
jgi:hypothetical protein